MKVKTHIETLGSEIKLSIYQRSTLYCALHNTKSSLKYLLECKKMFKGHDDENVLILSAERALLSEYKENLLAKENLFKKYNELYGEDFYRLKLEIEKELQWT